MGVAWWTLHNCLKIANSCAKTNRGGHNKMASEDAAATDLAEDADKLSLAESDKKRHIPSGKVVTSIS